jgi:hypothetical protein
VQAEGASYRKIAAEFKRTGRHDLAARNMGGDIGIGYSEARCLDQRWRSSRSTGICPL